MALWWVVAVVLTVLHTTQGVKELIVLQFLKYGLVSYLDFCIPRQAACRGLMEASGNETKYIQYLYVGYQDSFPHREIVLERCRGANRFIIADATNGKAT
jgi:hypothetical protein